MKGNAYKCRLIMSTDEQLQILAEIFHRIESVVEIYWSKIDSNLYFHDHIKTICLKVGNNLKALARKIPHMSIKKNILVIHFINTQFNYHLLIRKLHNDLAPEISHSNFYLETQSQYNLQ